MEGGEEHSEAQESDSRFGDPCKVEECFRLCHELYIKSSPLRKQQVNLSVAFAKKTNKKKSPKTFKCKCQFYDREHCVDRNMWICIVNRFSCSCLICFHLCSRAKYYFVFTRKLFARWIRLLNTHQMQSWETKTLCCNVVWRKNSVVLLTYVCRREFIVCSLIAQVFNKPNYFTVGLCMFLHTKTFCRQIRQFCIITKTSSQGLRIFFLNPAKRTRTADHFYTRAFAKTSDFGFQHGWH